MSALGVVVLGVAGFALRHPQAQGAATAADSRAPSPTAASSPAPVASTTPRRHPSSARPASTSATRSGSPTPSASPTVAAKKLPVIVLNNTTITGLAQQAADSFLARGWKVSEVGNLQNDILSTCAYFDPSVPGAQASARLLRRQFPAIKRVQPKFLGLPAGPIVVVLTPDYTSG